MLLSADFHVFSMQLCDLATGCYGDSLCFDAGIVVHVDRIPNNRVCLDSSEALLVLLHHVLDAALLRLLWNADSINHPQPPSGLNICILILHDTTPPFWLRRASFSKSCPLILIIPGFLSIMLINSLLQLILKIHIYWRWMKTVSMQQIPKWWIWLYYISPMSWTLNLLFTTQFGFEDSSNILVFGETKPIAAFVRDYFGFHRELLPLSAIILAAYPVLFAILYGYSISRFNFQKR